MGNLRELVHFVGFYQRTSKRLDEAEAALLLINKSIMKCSDRTTEKWMRESSKIILD